MFWNFDGSVARKFRGVDVDTGELVCGSYILPWKTALDYAKILVYDYNSHKCEEHNVVQNSVEQCIGWDPLFNEVYENDIIVDKRGIEYNVEIRAFAVNRVTGEVVDINDLDYDFSLK